MKLAHHIQNLIWNTFYSFFFFDFSASYLIRQVAVGFGQRLRRLTSSHAASNRRYTFGLVQKYYSNSPIKPNSSFNPLVPSAHKSVRISKISILKLEGIIKKISYERRDYESVDEKGLS